LHTGIVDQEIWDGVQRQLAGQTQARADPRRNTESFLAGKLYDDRGNRMGPSHAAKGGRRWRYYISRATLTGRKSEAGSVTRAPAPRIEKQVFDAVKGFIATRRLPEGFGALPHFAASGKTIVSHSAVSNPCLGIPDHVAVLDAIERVTIGAKAIEIQLSDAVAINGQDRTLTVPWVPSSPYQRREIIQVEDKPCASIRPMRVLARTVFAESLRSGGDSNRSPLRSTSAIGVPADHLSEMLLRSRSMSDRLYHFSRHRLTPETIDLSQPSLESFSAARCKTA
jgi:site-specific DNA recombinase